MDMNNWTRLLTVLDELFGHNKLQSRISKKVQGFDNKTGEMVIRIEYRVKTINESTSLIKTANDRLTSGWCLPPSIPNVVRVFRTQYVSHRFHHPMETATGQRGWWWKFWSGERNGRSIPKPLRSLRSKDRQVSTVETMAMILVVCPWEWQNGCHRTLNSDKRVGAGEGNRTLVCSLGSYRSTIKLHPLWPLGEHSSIHNMRLNTRTMIHPRYDS